MEIILFILFVVASVVFRILQPRIKGYLGEKSVATILSLLPSDKYKIINDLLIEVDGRTIQIDHLVVSIYGIFVIETKNYKGRITGSDNSDYWTKNMFGNKYTFYNPIRQNKSHVLALSKQLGFSLNKFIPIIVFSNGAELKVNTTHNVIYTTQINRVIKEYSERFTKELGNIYSVTTLKYMRMFYLLIEKGQPLADQLTWFYYCELLFIKYNIYYF
mgnify:CR=1 FL=1